MIPYGHQDVGPSEIEAVLETLRSDWLTQGPVIERFETRVAEICQAGYAAAVCNATAALHLACMALDLGPNDWLWTSPNTFVASANCALYCGARVDFVDIDPKTYNMCPQQLEQKLEHAERTGRLPKIVVPVHFAGQSCDMARIGALAKRYGFRVVEDASHAVGGQYESLPVGCCRYSDMTIFSFHPVKIVTTGEGGIVLTNSGELRNQVAMLRSHGITRDAHRMDRESEGTWYYQQIALGLNYRITDIQCALGLAQIDRLPAFLARRQEIATTYNRQLESIAVTRPWQSPQSRSAWHLYVIRVPSQVQPRRKVFDRLRAAGILVNVHYIPVHLQPYYRRLGFKRGDFPAAESYYEEAISLPIFFSLSAEDQDFVVRQLKEALQ